MVENYVGDLFITSKSHQHKDSVANLIKLLPSEIHQDNFVTNIIASFQKVEGVAKYCLNSKIIIPFL